MVLSGIAVQHADDGHSWRVNFGPLVHSMFLMYLSGGTNIYGSRGGEFEGIFEGIASV